jgi:3-dehydroquinate synthase
VSDTTPDATTPAPDTTAAAPTRVRVAGEQPYDVVVGRHLLGELPAMLGDRVRRVLVVHPAALAATAEVVHEDLKASGYEAYVAEVPDAEESKTAQVAAFLWGVLGQLDFTRTDAVVTVGGGATTDLGGFVAATWLRGIRVVHVPTTLLAMVDAAVGGKTGINTAEGKNLVGAFHPPAGVLCDLAALGRWDFVAGLAEVVKTGFIADERILELVEEHADALAAWGTRPTTDETWAVVAELVERSVAVKARVVGEDLKEAGLREILNYGHTLGHAVELTERYQWRHGAAVSVGMVFAAELSRLAGKLDDAVVERHRAILGSLGLPLTYRGDRWEQLMSAMRRDKKSRGDLLRFVVLDDVARPTRLEGPDPTLLAAAYAEIAADAPVGRGPIAL